MMAEREKSTTLKNVLCFSDGCLKAVWVSLEHEEQVRVPLQEVGVELLGGLDGLAHSARQHQLLDLCRQHVHKQLTSVPAQQDHSVCSFANRIKSCQKQVSSFVPLKLQASFNILLSVNLLLRNKPC